MKSTKTQVTKTADKKKETKAREEVITSFMVRKQAGRKGQGDIYVALKLREELGWEKGDLLTVKINKTGDGLEVRKLMTKETGDVLVH